MKGQTLKENKDFRRLYYRGKNEASSALVTYGMKSRGNGVRYGITTSKKIGGAVERNRARRVIRVAFRNIEPRINGSWDFVFVARTRTTKCKEDAVEKAMLAHMKAMGAVNEED